MGKFFYSLAAMASFIVGVIGLSYLLYFYNLSFKSVCSPQPITIAQTIDLTPQPNNILAQTNEISSKNESILRQKKTYSFKDYPVTEIYKGKNAPLKLTREEKPIYGEKLQYT